MSLSEPLTLSKWDECIWHEAPPHARRIHCSQCLFVVAIIILVAVIVGVKLVRPVVLAVIITIVVWVHAVTAVIVCGSAHF
jgi:hypothetical protein